MEDKDINNLEKQSSHVFIITPDELAKLGILDSLASKSQTNNEVGGAKLPSTATKPFLKKESEQLLKNIFNQKKLSGNFKKDTTLFKKPVEHAKFKEVKKTASCSKVPNNNIEETNSQKLKPRSKTKSKNISDTSNSSLILNKFLNKPRNSNILKTEDAAKSEPKRVSIISNTLVNIATEELSKIVSESLPKNKETVTLIKPKKYILNKTELSTAPKIRFNLNKFSRNYSKKNKSQTFTSKEILSYPTEDLIRNSINIPDLLSSNILQTDIEKIEDQVENDKSLDQKISKTNDKIVENIDMPINKTIKESSNYLTTKEIIFPNKKKRLKDEDQILKMNDTKELNDIIFNPLEEKSNLELSNLTQNVDISFQGSKLKEINLTHSVANTCTKVAVESTEKQVVNIKESILNQICDTNDFNTPVENNVEEINNPEHNIASQKNDQSKISINNMNQDTISTDLNKKFSIELSEKPMDVINNDLELDSNLVLKSNMETIPKDKDIQIKVTETIFVGEENNEEKNQINPEKQGSQKIDCPINKNQNQLEKKSYVRENIDRSRYVLKTYSKVKPVYEKNVDNEKDIQALKNETVIKTQTNIFLDDTENNVQPKTSDTSIKRRSRIPWKNNKIENNQTNKIIKKRLKVPVEVTKQHDHINLIKEIKEAEDKSTIEYIDITLDSPISENLFPIIDLEPKKIIENTSIETSGPILKKKRLTKLKCKKAEKEKIEIPVVLSKRGRNHPKVDYLKLNSSLDDDDEIYFTDVQEKSLNVIAENKNIMHNSDQPLKRKRGRPKKIILPDSINTAKKQQVEDKTLDEIIKVDKPEIGLKIKEINTMSPNQGSLVSIEKNKIPLNIEHEINLNTEQIENNERNEIKSVERNSPSQVLSLDQLSTNNESKINLKSEENQSDKDKVEYDLSFNKNEDTVAENITSKHILSLETNTDEINSTDDVINKQNTTIATTDPPLKRKRGRPRKSLPVQSVPLFSDESLILENISDFSEEKGREQESEEPKHELLEGVPGSSVENSEPVLKMKRGRKPKVMQPAEHIPTEEDIELPITESKRGRKHVKINYLEIENRLADEIQSSKKIKRTYSSTDHKDQIKENNEIILDESEDVSQEIVKPKSSSGMYKKMINEIFSASLKAEKPGENPTVSTNQILSKGRPKKNQESVFVIDDEGKVSCASCHEKINADDWNDHNEYKHNNLSWREGEPIMNMDQLAVRQIVKQIISKNKSITCLKCNKNYTKLNQAIFHIEECMGIVIQGNVICAICNKNMPRESWPLHKLKHNNLAWRVGDHALDLNNESFVVQNLNMLYKAKKPLYCDKCQTIKKSVVGLLSHKAQCGNVSEAKVPCEICGKKMLPVSIPTHIKFVHETPKKETSYFNVNLDLVPTKRKAAVKAISKMDELTEDNLEIFKHFVKQMNFEADDTITIFLNKELEDNKTLKCRIQNCDFSCEDTSGLLSHMCTCSLKPDQYYTCKSCFLVDSEEEILKHLELTHNIKIQRDVDYVCFEDGYDEKFDMTNEDDRKRQKRRNDIKNPTSNDSNYSMKPKFLREILRRPPSHFTLFSHAFKYTFQFFMKNFQHNILFENLICLANQWDLIDEDILGKYLPPSELSCDIVITNLIKEHDIYKSEHTFKKYELFEIQQEDAHITIFCGGPVLCQAWLPTPYTSSDQFQILAVAISKDFDAKYKHNENSSESTLIQFWNFGVLKNGVKMPEPKLEFCLGVDNGPIWQMEWCPSGCYNVDESVDWCRIGLLAVAGCSMPVHIYSIPLLKEDQIGLFYKVVPVLTLELVIDGNDLKRKIFPTKISWSKVSGHSFIAVGYSDGTVALYNLNLTSSLLRFRVKESSEILLPYKIIKIHSHFITALSWIPIDEGNRWLLTSSFDKVVHIWDLYNDDKFSIKKGKLIGDGAWLMNWLGFIAVSDESTSTLGQATATCNNYREYSYDTYGLSGCTSTISSISASDLLNGFVYGNKTGDINAFFPNQMLYDVKKKRRDKDRFVMGRAILIDKTVSPEERAVLANKKNSALRYITRNDRNTFPNKLESYDWYEPLNYKEAIEHYGIAFCDINQTYEASLKEDSNFSKPNLYPLQTINKICFNPNIQASLYYATGYQVGFIRLSYLKFLEQDRQIKNSQSQQSSL